MFAFHKSHSVLEEQKGAPVGLISTDEIVILSRNHSVSILLLH